MLEMFLESKSIQGFFTTLQIMSIVEDTDEQMIEDLQDAKDEATLARNNADQKAQEMKAVVEQSRPTWLRSSRMRLRWLLISRSPGRSGCPGKGRR
jgi:GTP-binding protein EngB required for normal cell division